MKIQVLFFASCRDIVGNRDSEMDVPDGMTLADLIERIGSEHPRFREIEPSLMVSVNQDYVDRSQALSAGDEVAFIPPVSGGGCRP